MAFFCKHSDELIRTDVLPSPSEQMAAANLRPEYVNNNLMFYRKKLVHVFRCTKCGRATTTEHVNP